MRWLTLLRWRIVWWWKHRTGFVDMGEDVAATGVIAAVEVGRSSDGDQNFDLRLDPGQERLITGMGGRLTTAHPEIGPTIHCEVPPWAPADVQAAAFALAVGQHVRVSGRWGFDGVHTGRPAWQEVILALWRHQPNHAGGWFEIHPVTRIEFLGPRAG